MEYGDALNSLKDFKVSKIGEGKVKYQSPKEGTRIETGTTVRLFLSS